MDFGSGVSGCRILWKLFENLDPDPIKLTWSATQVVYIQCINPTFDEGETPQSRKPFALEGKFNVADTPERS